MLLSLSVAGLIQRFRTCLVEPLFLMEPTNEDKLLRGAKVEIVAERVRADGDGVFLSSQSSTDSTGSVMVLRRRAANGILPKVC